MKRTGHIPTRESLVEVLLEAAERTGVQFKITRGQIRVKGPAGTAQLCRKIFLHGDDFAHVLGHEWSTGGNHDQPYDRNVQYLTADELARLRRWCVAHQLTGIGHSGPTAHA